MLDVPTLVAIPTLGRSEWLWPLLDHLQRSPDVTLIWVYDNGMPDHQRRLLQSICDDKLVRIDATGCGFYRMWNNAITAAATLDAGNLAILNDDIELPDGCITAMTAALRQQPDVGIVSPAREDGTDITDQVGYTDVTGTYKDRGINGACFTVRAETCPLIDEQYEYWYGDDDLVAKILAAGQRAVLIDGLAFTHHRSTTLNTVDRVHDICTRDAQRWKELHL